MAGYQCPGILHPDMPLDAALQQIAALRGQAQPGGHQHRMGAARRTARRPASRRPAHRRRRTRSSPARSRARASGRPATGRPYTPQCRWPRRQHHEQHVRPADEPVRAQPDQRRDAGQDAQQARRQKPRARPAAGKISPFIGQPSVVTATSRIQGQPPTHRQSKAIGASTAAESTRGRRSLQRRAREASGSARACAKAPLATGIFGQAPRQTTIRRNRARARRETPARHRRTARAGNSTGAARRMCG